MGLWERVKPPSSWAALWRAPVGRALIVAAAGLLAATAVGLWVMWPGSTRTASSRGAQHTESAKVVSVIAGPCQQGECRFAEVRMLSGGDRGRDSVVTFTPQDRSPHYSAGDRVRVLPNERRPPPNATGPAGIPEPDPTAGPPSEFTYSIVDYDRRLPMVWLAVAFGVLVILAGRVRGLLSLVGLGTGIVIVTQFVIPAMVAHRSPFLVALVGSLATMFVTVGLTSGLSAQSLAASLGIAGSLLIASGLGVLYVHIAHLTGLSSDVATTLSLGTGLSLQGLVLAGFVIGALGVLADMAVTQASTVMALRRANPELGFGAVYREAFAVGRDHLSATVNTLVFAYVGATLPLLLLFKTAGVTFTDAINTQEVSEAVIATLVGAIGVIASVPLTTGLATLLATRLPAGAVPVDPHGHAHHHRLSAGRRAPAAERRARRWAASCR